MSSLIRLVILSLLLTTTAVTAQDTIPADLEDWTRWVLKDKEYLECPLFFDRGASTPADFACVWPGQLQLTVDASGGRFSQTWTVYADDQWLALIARDEGCIGCGLDPARCEAHHIRWVRHAGPTDIDNLVLVCSHCHHLIHDAGWRVLADDDGRWTLVPP